jgi:uncharacterized protein YPO0396
MKRLEAIRLVQWFHFEDETMPIGGSCLLLGDNGSGKTTVLDAIQCALVADFNEILLNRAANEKSQRTLYGYVRWKLGFEDESQAGNTHFAREACTSYVMLEFRDIDKPDEFFTCGIGFEAGTADKDVAKLYFVLPGITTGEVEAVVVDTVRPLREFRGWIRSGSGRYWNDAGTYREELRQRLGVLPASFHRLIVKALAFKPIGQVRQFVFDYLLDERPINTDALQSNLDHYKRLEGEAREAEKRISELDEIVREGERIRTEQRTAESHRYMELRAERETADVRVQEVSQSLSDAQAELDGFRTRAQCVREQIEFCDKERDRLVRLLESHEVYRHLQDLERQLHEVERRRDEAASADEEARKLLRGQSEALDRLLSEEARALRRSRAEFFERDDLLGAEEAPELLSRLRSTLLSEGALTGRDLATWQRRLDRAADRARELRLVIRRELEAAKSEGIELQQEQRALEAGRQRYPEGAAALLHLLSTRLKSRREPKPLCELIEIPNPRWRDAVEGYLNTRRFDVIVDAGDYARALSLYERHKRDYSLPGRGNVFISGVGLVDIERVLRHSSRCEARSLAEQVETRDPYARAYCDFLLGDVICVDDEQSMRKHRSAITDTVMVYRNHVARQTAREVYSRHFIGEAARLRRLDEIAGRLAELHDYILRAAGEGQWLDKAIGVVDEARTAAVRLPQLIENAEGLAGFKLQAVRLAAQKDKIDRSEIRLLENDLHTTVQGRLKLQAERSDLDGKIGAAENEITHRSDVLTSSEKQAAEAARILNEFASGCDRTTLTGYDERYLRERTERSPQQIHDVFERQRRSIETRVENLVQRLVGLKAQYIVRHGFAASSEGAGFAEFAVEHETWRESRLPAYKEKISEAKTKALQQLAEDIIFRLRENLLLVRSQIDDLNRALKDVPFGSEQYQFTVDVDPAHRDFYNLVIDAGRYEKESLFGAAALGTPELKDTLAGLLDRLVEAEARQVKTELEAKADYREYFNYDLKILHADGRHSLYDKVAGDKSGGETQTPYYIAILASMYRLYRSRSLDGMPTCGLVLLDEAFSKMDESRIAATLMFARKLSLQLVLATPKERSELVAPKVERSLLIHKDAIGGIPTVLDFTKEFSHDEGFDARSSQGTAHTTARRL